MIEEKLEALTKEVVALRQVIEKAGGLAPTKAAEKAKPAAKGKAKPAEDDDADEEDDEDAKPAKKPAGKKKPPADEPEHDEDEVGAMFRKAAKIDRPRCKKYLEKKDCEDLAELLTQPELWDAAYAFAEAIVEEDED